jgi:palmitoyltransferase
MENLRPRHNDDYDSSSDEDEAERRALGRKATVGWPQKVGVVTNTVLGNTLLKYMIWNRDNEAPKKY